MYNLILVIFLIPLATGARPFDPNFHYLVPGKIHSTLDHYGNQKLSIYCYSGVPKHILHMFQTVSLSLSLAQEEYELYNGASPTEILQVYEEHHSSWNIELFTWRSKSIQLDPFNVTCVGVDTAKDHKAIVHIIRVDYWRVLVVVGGVLLFLAAPRLSSNSFFYYICGITLGVTTSFLILVYLLSKLLPFKRPAMYGFLLGGWTIGVYLFQLVWQNLRTIAVTYQSHVLAYSVLSALLSFAVCYWFGPVTDPRSKNLIKWSLQLSALGSIFYSSYHQEASLAVILVLLTYYNFPTTWTSSLLTYWKRKFPPKTRLLSEDEYHEQGARETVKALDEMRKYCSSPECNQWRTMLKLKEPIRFAEFMEGRSHLKDEEVLEYESSKPVYVRDESDTDDSF